MRYICENCENIIEEDDLIKEIYYDRVEFWGEPTMMPYEIYKCPYCNNEDIEEYD